MITKSKRLFVGVLLLILVSVLLGCAVHPPGDLEWEKDYCSEPVDTSQNIMQWFDVEFDTYGDLPTVSVDFYYTKEHIEETYFGTINFIKQDGVWIVDEYVDLLPYCSVSEEDIYAGMVRYANAMLSLLNYDPTKPIYEDDIPADIGE